MSISGNVMPLHWLEPFRFMGNDFEDIDWALFDQILG